MIYEAGEDEQQISAKPTPRVTARHPKPLVLTGPSGAGKSTLTGFITKNLKDKFAFLVSSTTRQPREGEVNGVHYNFISKEEFESQIKAGEFLEYNEVHGNYYGTSKSQVLSFQGQGKICILDIDVKGARDINKTGSVECNYIFINAPSIEELRRRLEARGTETEETLAKRIGNAEKEVKAAQQLGIFQKFIVNDKEDTFLQECQEFIIKGLYGLSH